MNNLTNNVIEIQKVQKRTSWFFGIGINNYEYFPKLKNAVKDVQDILDVLVDKFDVDEDNIIFLKNEKATEDNIAAQLRTLAQVVNEEDKLIIYYSGHGLMDEIIDEGFWIPINGVPGSLSRYIPNSLIRKYVKHIKAKHILLISDACFAGSIFDRGAQRSTQAIEDLDRYRSRWALCSGRNDQTVSDGAPGENSPFAKSILNVLKATEKEDLSISKLSYQVVESTRANYHQLPEGNPLFDTGHAGGEYIFRLKERSGLVQQKTGPGPSMESGLRSAESETITEVENISANSLKKAFWMIVVAVIIIGLIILGMYLATQDFS